MRFIDRWLPLIVLVQEANLDRAELAEMSNGLEPFFQRRARYAVLALMSIDARPPDALARMRLASWLNQPRIRRLSRELCVGSAAVTARDGERRVMQGLFWLWNPAVPHRAVRSVSEGLRFCLDQLSSRDIALPARRHALELDVERTLAALPVTGLTPKAGGDAAADQRPRDRAAAPGSVARRDEPTPLRDGQGEIALRWLAEGVLWACFRGRLTVTLAAAHAVQLEQCLSEGDAVRYFIDASALDSIDLVGRKVVQQALAAHRHRFRSIELSSSGKSSSSMAGLGDPLASLVRMISRSEFEARLLRAAPSSTEQVRMASRLSARPHAE